MPKKRSQLEVIADFKRVHGDRYDYSQVRYRGAKEKIEIVCRAHGPFELQPSHHINGVGCRHCYFESNRKGLTHFLERCTAAHSSRFDYSLVSETVKTTDKVSIRCKVHDHWFDQSASAHMNGHVGCPKCLSNKLSGPAALRGEFKAEEHTQNHFVARAIAVHGNAYIYDRFKYQGMARKGEFICPRHGSFHQTPSNHLRGTGCPHCAKENQHLDSLKAECFRKGIDYWNALKRREAGMSAELVLSGVSLRSERRTNPVTVHGLIYPNMEAAVRKLKPVASSHTLARWIASGMTPEDAFVRVPNPGYANGTIYVVEHVPTGRRYVGLTVVSHIKRWRQHIEQARARHIKSLESLHAAIRTHGEAEFSVRVVDTGTTKLDLESKERHWIVRLETLVPKGFNISPGGGSGGAMGRETVVDGLKFTTIREAANHVANTRGISFEAAKGRLRSGRLDVTAPSKPGHAVSRTPAYKAWSRIVHCVTNPNSKDFVPGVALHPGWADFHKFLKDVGQPSEKGQVLARLDKGKGFTSDNCVWMGKSEASQRNAAQMKQAGTLVGRGKKSNLMGGQKRPSRAS
ncbi:putative endonuclease [Hydrogenophaga taeniospiralis CCUG 15921]|uniref:Endonuclease n=1 Tax=Hydrogenophaga taeniospiralis CCUG 15921 TaxID=1281780 RepID=A0A9X4SAP8_9BURK|nr:GIY-YIG nuclease family protein [Hydrogenophaga taeniospiralis]MDG5974448.1 putative endonuclease [Hydrogenophaga taeniospiralis CCUG 15921]